MIWTVQLSLHRIMLRLTINFLQCSILYNISYFHDPYSTLLGQRVCFSCRSTKMITDAEVGRVPVKAVIWHLYTHIHSLFFNVIKLRSYKVKTNIVLMSDALVLIGIWASIIIYIPVCLHVWKDLFFVSSTPTYMLWN